jgi:hypothetical protein
MRVVPATAIIGNDDATLIVALSAMIDPYDYAGTQPAGDGYDR